MNFRDEPDFEVIDLRTGLPDERVYTHADERRQRRRQLSGAISVLVVVIALVLPFVTVPGFVATVRQALHLPPPASSPTLTPGADVVYFEHGLSWGVLLMDGKRITNTDTSQAYTGLEELYTSLRIPGGRHRLEYRAAPFPTIDCWLSAPPAASDTCPLASDPRQRDVQPPLPSERVIDLGGSPAHLSPALRSALEAAVAHVLAQLSTSTTLTPGDAFATADGTPAVATSAMAATLSYALATNPNDGYTIPGSLRACGVLCTSQPASYISDLRAEWVIAAHVIPTWTYTRDNGATTIRGNASPRGVSPDSIVPLSVRWDGAWRVRIADAEATSPICFIALNLFAALHLTGAPLASLRLYSAPTPADGCVAAGAAVDATGTPRIPFTVLYRFGLLFAVDDEAHQLLPGMQSADARLQGLARAWSS